MTSSPAKPRKRTIALYVALFLLGYFIGHIKIPTPPFLSNIKKNITGHFDKNKDQAEGRKKLFEMIFNEQTIKSEMLNPPIHTLDDISNFNDALLTPRIKYLGAYQRIQLIDDQMITLNSNTTKVITVRYKLDNRFYVAKAYGAPPTLHSANFNALLLIPGTGQNQATELIDRAHDKTTDNIHTIFSCFGSQNVFVLIKPNEDADAWHNGNGKKLSMSAIVSKQINLGGSYSVSYLIHSLAITKYLTAKYKGVVVSGLSQGGAAALLNSIQSRPTAAIVSSGFSTLNKKIEWASTSQILAVPGYSDLFDEETIKSALSATPTKYLFTWGKAESDIYKIEAEERITAKILANLNNVTSLIHEQGHIYPTGAVTSFLSENGLCTGLLH